MSLHSISFRGLVFPLLAIGLALVSGLFAAQPQPILVKNIHEGEVTVNLDPNMQVALGDRALFTADDGVHGRELWISDGTPSGSLMVKDIWEGKNSAAIVSMTVSANKAYFKADDGIHGPELWVTDGTAAGTRMVADIVPGDDGSMPDQFAAYGDGVILITTPNSSSEISVWYSEGTSDGTWKLADAPKSKRNGVLRTCSDGARAWILLPNSTDTQDCIFRIEGEGASVSLTQTHFLPNDGTGVLLGILGNDLLFQLYVPHPYNPSRRNESLWKFGLNGAAQIAPLMEAPIKILNNSPKMVIANGKAYFIRSTVDSYSSLGYLWVSDGTETGTRFLDPVATSEKLARDITLVGQKLVATLGDSSRGRVVWSYDVQNGSEKVLLDGRSFTPELEFSRVTRLGDQVVFGSSPSLGEEPTSVWVSNGSAAGTRYLSRDLSPEEGNSWESHSSVSVVVAGSTAFFQIQAATGGVDLWKSNGSEVGTQQVTGPLPQEGSSLPQQLRSLGGLLYFASDDGVHGRELWCSDGTSMGTLLLRDIHPGDSSSEPQHMVEMDGFVYFTAVDPEHGRELWRTDGTPTGTILVKDTLAGREGGIKSQPVVFKGRLFFELNAFIFNFNQRQLWCSDGTAEGTRLYAPASQETIHSPKNLTVMDGWLYFSAYDTSRSSYVLLRSDGVSETLNSATNVLGYAAARMVVRPPFPGAALAPDKHVLFIAVNEHLWRCCNGEAAVKIHSSSNSWDTIDDMQVNGDGVLLIRNPECHLDNLWRSNGTLAGTGRWGPSGDIRLMHKTTNKIYYSQFLWREDAVGYIHHSLNSMNMDGTVQQRLVPEDLVPSQQANYHNISAWTLHTEGETAYFGRSVRGSMWGLGRTRGTPETTRMITTLPLSRVQELGLWGNEVYALPQQVVQKLGSRLYFAGNNGDLGDELYSINIDGHFEVAELLSGSSRNVESGGTVTLPLTAIGQQQQRTLRLHNEGALSLSDIVFSLTPESDFSIQPMNVGTLAPGAVTEILITFSPKAGGLRQDTLQIAALGTTTVTHSIQLTAAGLGMTDAPVLRASPPKGLFILAGQPLTLQADILTSAPFISTFWKRDATQVSGSQIFTLPAARLSDAGSYTLTATTAAGVVTTAPAAVCVITPAPASVTIGEWSALSLTCSAKVPKGFNLSYQWRYNGIPLNNDAVLKGSRLSTLKISNVETSLAGEYDCLVTLIGAQGPVLTESGPVSLSQGITHVSVQARPRILAPPESLSWPIGQPVNHQITTDIPSIGFTVKGLPPGLKMSRSGLITGKPLRSRAADPGTGEFLPYPVSLTATNAAGYGPSFTLPIQVTAFMPSGGYDCLLDPLPGSTRGSHLKFTIAPTGALSGQLLHRGKNLRFTGSLLETNLTSLNPQFIVNLSRGTQSLKLIFTPPDSELNPWKVTLEESVEIGSITGDCRRHVFSASHPAAAYVGTCTWSLYGARPAPDPEGAGYMTATITKTGIVVWKGRLPDGTAIAGSNSLSSYRTGSSIDLPIHVDLYKLSGSLHGAVVLPAEADLEAVPLTMSGALSWGKDALPGTSKERNYKDGFTLHDLAVEGGRYEVPGAGVSLFGIEDSEASADASLSVAGLEMTQSFVLSVKHIAYLPPILFDKGTFLKSLSFSTKTGTFKGSLTIMHATDIRLNRTVSFEGVILSTQQLARGYFLLPASSQATSHLQSGLIGIQPHQEP